MTEPPYSWSSPSGDPASPPPTSGYGPPAPGEPAAASPYGQPPSGYQYGQPAWMQPGVVPLRPLALGEILDGAIKVIRRYPRPTLGLSAAIALVTTLLNVISVLLIDPPKGGSAPGEELTLNSSSSAASLASAIPASLISFVAGLVLTGALITVVGRAVQGQEAPMATVWATVRPRIWALIGLALLTVIIAFAPFVATTVGVFVLAASAGNGSFAIGIPLMIAGLVTSVYLYVRLSLGSAALILEKTSITAAIKRSGVLVKGSWWRIFGILLLAFIIAFIISSIVGVPLILIATLAFSSASDGTAFLVAQQVAGGIASILLAPFSAGVTALLYVDRRMRAEGLDVALRAAVTSGPAEPAR